MKRIGFYLTLGVLVSAAAAQVPAPAPPPPPSLDLRDFEDMRARMGIDVDRIREEAQRAAEEARESIMRMGPFAFAPQPGPPTPPRPFKIEMRGRHDNTDRAYERGQRARDDRRWDEALDSFSQVAAAGGPRAEGALYWKAYVLGKLGRTEDAVAAIAELRKSYASSRWLDDAKALELQLRQASGQRVTPESENDEELELMALNGLVQSDPDRAVPLLENLLKTSTSAKLKERAIFVLAQSNSARGKQLLEQVARGGAGNPDLQLKAISYITAMSRRTDNRQLLWDIYSGSNDVNVSAPFSTASHPRATPNICSRSHGPRRIPDCGARLSKRSARWNPHRPETPWSRCTLRRPIPP